MSFSWQESLLLKKLRDIAKWLVHASFGVNNPYLLYFDHIIVPMANFVNNKTFDLCQFDVGSAGLMLFPGGVYKTLTFLL